jgi:hypothetical protein
MVPPKSDNIDTNMKTISVAVSEADYRAFQEAAEREHRPVAQLIREAMAEYRARRLPEKTALRQLPVLAGHRPIAPLPSRSEIYDEIFDE